jgi:lipoyl(octanoyl) transferase
MRLLEVHELGRVPYAQAWDLQRTLSAKRKEALVPDQLLLLEHPHVLTLGRNGHMDNILVSRDRMEELGIELHEINRGGDITYHGPGQIVGYPILNLREWKRDVVAYVRAIEEVVIRAIGTFGIRGRREPGATGVWVDDAPGGPSKICAIGVHISRWVTTHGFALNWTTDLDYFRCIVPCGLPKPVTSMEHLQVKVDRADVHQAIVRVFADVFDCSPVWSQAPLAPAAGA